jgi:hypothetical protein
MISKENKSSNDLNNTSRKVTTANFTTITNGKNIRDEKSRYLILGTKAIEDGHTFHSYNIHNGL